MTPRLTRWRNVDFSGGPVQVVLDGKARLLVNIDREHGMATTVDELGNVARHVAPPDSVITVIEPDLGDALINLSKAFTIEFIEGSS